MEEEIDLDREAEKEYRKLRQKDTNERLGSLSDSDEEEYQEIVAQLRKFEDVKGQRKISEALKKRIARFALDLVHKTPKDKEEIMNVSYALTSFIFYSFDDELDDIFGIAGELELPEEHVSGNVFEMWKDIEKKLREYLE